jgi:hypothetical protein
MGNTPKGKKGAYLSERNGKRMLGVFVPIDLYEELARVSKENERSMAATTRLALRHYLDMEV